MKKLIGFFLCSLFASQLMAQTFSNVKVTRDGESYVVNLNCSLENANASGSGRSKDMQIAMEKARFDCRTKLSQGNTGSTPNVTPTANTGSQSSANTQVLGGLSCPTSGDGPCTCAINGIMSEKATAQKLNNDNKQYCNSTANPFDYLKNYEPNMWDTFLGLSCGESKKAGAYVSQRNYSTGLNIGGLKGEVEVTCSDNSKKKLYFDGGFTAEIMKWIIGEKDLTKKPQSSSQTSQNSTSAAFDIGRLHCIPVAEPATRCTSNCPNGKQQCSTTVVCNDNSYNIVCDCETYDATDGAKNCLLEWHRKSRESRSNGSAANDETSEH